MKDNQDDTKRAVARRSPSKKRKAPRIELRDGNEINVDVDTTTQLRDLYGTKTVEAANGILTTALNALGVNFALYRDLMTSMAVEMEPKDAVEAMLVSQMTTTHVAMMAFAGKLADASSPGLREAYERSTTRLSRTFLAQMEALKKYRAKAQQVVRVERVMVNEGGQAIVGPVSHGGEGRQ